MIEPSVSPFRIWLILLVMTGLSLLFAERIGIRTVAVVGMFVIAGIKAGLVMDHYMELRLAGQQWLILYSIWTVVVTGMLIVGHIGPVPG